MNICNPYLVLAENLRKLDSTYGAYFLRCWWDGSQCWSQSVRALLKPHHIVHWTRHPGMPYHMVPYRTISYHKPYQTIPNQIKPYQTKSNHTKPNQTKSNHTKWYQTFLNQTKPHCLIDPATWNAIQHLLGFNFRKVVTITCNLCPESSVVQMLINIYRQHNAQIICFRVQYWLDR